MHVTLLALGSRGDVQPYAALGAGLLTAGHRVRFVTFESFADLVAEHDLALHAIRGDARALVAGAGADTLALVRSFGALAEGYARDLSAPILGETDVIVNQLPGGLYGYDLAEKYGVPMVLASVIPLARTSAFPLMGFPRIPVPGYHRATYILGEQLVWQMFRGVTNRWRRRLGLRPSPLTGHFSSFGTSRHPIVNGFSPLVVPRPKDWGAHIHLTGYWLSEARGWQPPEELLRFIEAGTPPVFIGFGSMPIKSPERVTASVLAALERSGQRAVLHSGWGGLGQAVLPKHVLRIDFAPYRWLFPRMAMTLHHGGSGTTALGLHAGVPSGVVSFVFDQHYWGERIAALGVGPRPIRHTALTAGNLADAIQRGTSDEALRGRAAALGERLRAEDGIASAVALIERIVDTRARRAGDATDRPHQETPE